MVECENKIIDLASYSDLEKEEMSLIPTVLSHQNVYYNYLVGL